MTILVDSSEPQNIVNLLKQATEVVVSPLNQHLTADYCFSNYDGKRIQWGRVQAGELVGDIDSMEDEFKRYYNSADVTNQIIEGLISPVRLFMKGGSAPIFEKEATDIRQSRITTRDLGASIYCYHIEPSGFIPNGHSFSTARMAELYAWIYRLDQVGISTFYTNNWEETARLLITVYRNEQKAPDEHTTLKRVIRPHISTTDADPLVKALMSLSLVYKLGIGEVTAKALAGQYCSLLDIATTIESDLTSVDGVGRTTAKKLLVALGR